jgi:hypothetical protein
MINGNDIGDRFRHRYLARRSMTASSPVILAAAAGTRPAVARNPLQRLAVTGRDCLGWPLVRRVGADRRFGVSGDRALVADRRALNAQFWFVLQLAYLSEEDGFARR